MWELTRLGVRQTFGEGTSYRVLAQGAVFAAVLLCSENNLSPLGQERVDCWNFLSSLYPDVVGM